MQDSPGRLVTSTGCGYRTHCREPCPTPALWANLSAIFKAF
jgi:hypothetical protein